MFAPPSANFIMSSPEWNDQVTFDYIQKEQEKFNNEYSKQNEDKLAKQQHSYADTLKTPCIQTRDHQTIPKRRPHIINNMKDRPQYSEPIQAQSGRCYAPQDNNQIRESPPTERPDSQLTNHSRTITPPYMRAHANIPLDVHKKMISLQQIFKIFKQFLAYIASIEGQLNEEFLLMFILNIVSNETNVEFEHLLKAKEL
jgi:hypothetical protein